MLSYKNFMISPTELNNILEKNKDVVVIDVRFKEEYNKGHIYIPTRGNDHRQRKKRLC